MLRFIHRPLALFALAVSPVALMADTSAPRHLGVGDSFPATNPLTRDGSVYDLAKALSEKPAVLIFYRGGWCPYCNAHLAAITDIEGDLAAMGVRLIAISPDQPSKLHDAPARKVDPGYLLLSDQEMKLCDALGLSFVVPDELVAKYKNSYHIDLEAAAGRTHHKLPHPAVFVVGTDRVIRFAHVNPDYKKRLEPAKIVEAAKAVARR